MKTINENGTKKIMNENGTRKINVIKAFQVFSLLRRTSEGKERRMSCRIILTWTLIPQCPKF